VQLGKKVADPRRVAGPKILPVPSRRGSMECKSRLIRNREARPPLAKRPSAEARRITKQEVYSRKMEFHLDCGRDVFVEDIGYSDGITPVLAVPESRAPNGTGAG